MTEAQQAYIAGILDGEGYVSLNRKAIKASTRQQYGSLSAFSYRPLVSVSNTSADLLGWLRSTTGVGTIHKMGRVGNQRPAWNWQVWSQEAGKLLIAARPYMVVKARQADLVIEFSQRFNRYYGGCKGRSAEEWAAQGQIHAELAVLNKRGL